MISRFLIITFFTCASLSVQAQVNLVKNPSLEGHWRCPVNYDEIVFANYWSGIDTIHTFPAVYDTFGNPNCTPEYINSCSPYAELTEPINSRFYHYCRTGNGMAQVQMYFDEGFVTAYKRDYLQGRLSSPLIAGQSYCVTFFVVLEEASKYAINNIGAYFDDGSIDTNSNCGYPHPENVPQVVATSIITDTLNWTKIQGSFIANGTEKYITIGNFYDNAHTSVVDVRPGVLPGAFTWYLVDDVSVIASNTPANAGNDVTINAGCSTYIGLDSNGDGMPCYWYMMGGTSPIDSGGRILVKPASTTNYVVSMDLCGTVTYDTVTVNVTACAGPPVASFTAAGIDTVSFTYTGTGGCVDSIAWSFGDGGTSTDIDPVHYYSVTGTYTVCAVVHTFCGSDTMCSVINVTLGTPVVARKQGSVVVYPNPVNDVLHIDGVQQSTSYQITNITGVLMQEGILDRASNTLSIKGYPPGVYIFELTNADGHRIIQRVVKE